MATYLTKPDPKPPVDARHAFRVGTALGLLMKHGISATPVYVRGTADYSSTISFSVPNFGQVFIEVLPDTETQNGEEDAR